jgi:hypothetical protein
VFSEIQPPSVIKSLKNPSISYKIAFTILENQRRPVANDQAMSVTPAMEQGRPPLSDDPWQRAWVFSKQYQKSMPLPATGGCQIINQLKS